MLVGADPLSQGLGGLSGWGGYSPPRLSRAGSAASLVRVKVVSLVAPTTSWYPAAILWAIHPTAPRNIKARCRSCVLAAPLAGLAAAGGTQAAGPGPLPVPPGPLSPTVAVRRRLFACSSCTLYRKAGKARLTLVLRLLGKPRSASRATSNSEIPGCSGPGATEPVR